MPFTDWEPYTRFVQQGLLDNRFVNGQFCLLASGPPRLSQVGGSAAFANALSVSGSGEAQIGNPVADNMVWPLGLIQNINLSQNINFSRIFEIGSSRSYIIPGRSVGQLGFGSIWYDGPSLLRRVYAYYHDFLGNTQIRALLNSGEGISTPNPHDVVIPPGYENLFLNLASDLFAQPIGLLLYIKDNDKVVMGAVYFEQAVVPTHNWSTDSQGLIIAEQLSIQFERMVPVKVRAAGLRVSGLAHPEVRAIPR